MIAMFCTCPNCGAALSVKSERQLDISYASPRGDDKYDDVVVVTVMVKIDEAMKRSVTTS